MSVSAVRSWLVVGCAAFPFAVCGADAATHKVPQQFATIQAAIDQAIAGDVIKVAKGVYPENLSIENDGLTIVGKGAIVDGAGIVGAALVDITGCSGVTIKGLTVRDAAGAAAIRLTTTSDVVVERCRVLRPLGHGIAVNLSQGVVLRDNVVKDAGGDGIRVESDAVLARSNRVHGSTGANVRVFGSLHVIEDNVLLSAQEDSLVLGDGGSTTTTSNLVAGNVVKKAVPPGVADGIRLRGAPGSAILDNVVVGMSEEGIDEDGGSAGSVIQGNTVKSSLQTGLEWQAAGMAVLDNSVDRNGRDGLSVVGGDESYIRGNRARANDARGFVLAAAECLLLQNAATNNGTSDLGIAGVDNVFIDNHFPVIDFIR